MFRPPQLCAVWGRVAVAATLLVAVPGVARAQFERASVSGTITDQQGGVVPGVTITAVQVTTQQSRTAVSDASGYYSIPSLMPGKYDISVELDGFKKTTRAAVQLDAAASVTLAFTLEPGALTEVVTVTSDAPPLQTDVTVRKTVEAKDLEQLSFSGRNPARRPGAQGRRGRRQLQQPAASRPSATAASTSTAAAPKRTTSRSTAPSPSAPGRPARSSASRTSTRSRKCRC